MFAVLHSLFSLVALAASPGHQEQERIELIRNEFKDVLEERHNAREALRTEVSRMQTQWDKPPYFFEMKEESTEREMISSLREVDRELRDIRLVSQHYLDKETQALARERTMRLISKVRVQVREFLTAIFKGYELKFGEAYYDKRQGLRLTAVMNNWSRETYREVTIRSVSSEGEIEVTFALFVYPDPVEYKDHIHGNKEFETKESSVYRIDPENRMSRVTWYDSTFPRNYYSEFPGSKVYEYEDYIAWKTIQKRMDVERTEGKVRSFTEKPWMKKHIEDLIED